MGQTSKVKQYFGNCFKKKLLMQKGIIAICALFLVLAISLPFYYWLHDKTGEIGRNPFWYIYITHNSGVGWSLLDGNYAAIYTILSVVFILLTAVFILVTHDKITSSFVALAMFGGLFNLIQRGASGTNAVLDYFQFGFWQNFPVFNWPDMFVVIGVFGFVISYIVLTIIEIVKEEKQKVKNEPKH